MSQTSITLLFELKRHKGRFYIFTLISLFFITLSGLIPNLINPDLLPDTFNDFASSQLSFINFIIIFASFFFFGAIIAEEFQYKTNLILFPKINKLKLIAGKFLGNIILFLSVLSIYYLYYLILGLIFFQQISFEFFLSYLFTLLYGIAVSTFILAISSFMRSVLFSIIISFLLLFVGFNIISTVLTLFLPYVEPIYLMTYHGNMNIRIFNFPDVRFQESTFLFYMRTWLTPSIIVNISIQLIYIGFDLIISYFIFNLREL